MWVWLVDSWTQGCSWTCSIPTLVPILFSPVSHPYISWNFFKIFFMCLFVYFFDGLWPLEMISLPPPASTLILTSLQFVCLVFHFRHTPWEAGGKLESNSLKHFLSVWAWVTQVARLMAIKLKGARTYCIINKATLSGAVAMNYFS